MAVECRSDFISSHDDMIRQLESYIVLYMDGTVVGEVLCRSRCTWGVLYSMPCVNPRSPDANGALIKMRCAMLCRVHSAQCTFKCALYSSWSNYAFLGYVQ